MLGIKTYLNTLISFVKSNFEKILESQLFVI
jgi:hypothetical protein